MRKTLEHEDAAFMHEARGYCETAGYDEMYRAIDRRINYGDEVRVSPMDCVTVLGSSRPQMIVNGMNQDLDDQFENPHIYHHAPLVQVVR